MTTSWTTTTELLPHQAAAVAKLAPLRVGGLFMEQGTGKTRTAIELAHRRAGRYDRLVWLCPVALKHTAWREWHTHTDLPSGQVAMWDDRTSERSLPAALVHIIGLEALSSSARVVLALQQLITTRTFVVLDESSYIKGHRAYRTQRATVLTQRVRYRLILTGTPITQGVEDLFAQLYFLSPKILGYQSWYSFAANHLEYSDTHRGLVVRAHRTDLLAAKVAPYVYQVTKAECLALPAKQYSARSYQITPEQWAAYAEAKALTFDRIEQMDDPADSIYWIFRLFGWLQQIVCGFWRHPEHGEVHYPHRRLEVLTRALPASGKVIIWAKYRRCVADIVTALGSAHGADQVAQLTGERSPAQREAELARWRPAGGARFLVATPAVGGHGLTLNEAHCAVFYTNGFKYSERAQAEDRLHRIGQTQPVTYLDIVADGTIDERIQRALARKEGLADSFRREVQSLRGAGKAEARRAIRRIIEEAVG